MSNWLLLDIKAKAKDENESPEILFFLSNQVLCFVFPHMNQFSVFVAEIRDLSLSYLHQ